MNPTQQLALLVVFASLIAACGGAAPAAESGSSIEPFAEFDRMPSGVAVIGNRVFVSFPRWVEAGTFTVAEIVDGEPVAYPSEAANDVDAGPESLHSVNGIHMDSRGWLWILDNGRVDLRPAADDAPKLVVWDTVGEREVFRHVFDAEIAPPGGSFLNDIAVDEEHGFAYISESGIGGTPCLIAFEIHRDRATRVLEGHDSVVPDGAREMVIDGQTVMLHRPDGPVPWRVSVNSIGLLPGGDELLFGPMTSEVLYTVPTVALRDGLLSAEERGAAVGVFSEKPISDGMAVASDGGVFVTDVEAERVVTLASPGGDVATWATDPRFSFPVALEVTESAVWFTSNQLHRMPLLLASEDRRSPPYYLWRIAR